MATAAAAAVRVLPHSSNVSHIFSMINEVLPSVVRGDPLLLLFKTEEELVSKVLGFGKSNTPTELCLYPPTQLMNYATVGSDNGWLLIAHPDSAFATSPSKYKYKYKYSLYNPITSVVVQLPPPPLPLPPRGGTVCRFVTSTTPTDPQCLIFAYICYNNPDNVMTELNVLAYCKPGDESWHVIQTTTTPNHDMIFHEGELYTVDFDGVLSVFRKDKMKVLKTPNFKTTDLINNGNWFKSSCYYLVKESGEILMVERAVRILGRRFNVLTETLSFRILKLKRRWWNKAAAAAATKWEEVSTFGNADQALFLQRGDSMFVSTIEYTNYKPNCIYFIDDFSEDDPLNHVRVYDLKSRTIQPVNYDSSSSSIGVRADYMCRWFKASSV